MDRTALIALGLIGLGGLAYAATRVEANQGPQPTAPGLGGQGAGFGGLSDGAYAYDPSTGQYYDYSNPPNPEASSQGGGLGPAFSPEYESAVLDELRRANAANETEQRRINNEIASDSASASRFSQVADLANVGLALAFGAPLIKSAGGAIARGGASLLRGGAGAVAKGGAQSRLNAFGVQNATRTARLGNLATRSTALLRAPPVAYGGAAAAGVALGLGGTAVLEKSGALDALDRGNAAEKTIAFLTPKAVEHEAEVAVKSVALPLAAVGAVATGVVGRGSVRGNLRQAYRGTVQESVVNATRDAAKDTSSAVSSGYKSTKKFFRGLVS